MEWGSSYNFIWLWALPAMGVLFYLASWRKKSQMERFGEAALVERLIASLDTRKRLLKRILFATAIAFIVLALGQPHFRTK